MANGIIFISPILGIGGNCWQVNFDFTEQVVCSINLLNKIIMATYNDFNLRGALISPKTTPTETIHYYLCVIDAPDGVSQEDFTLVPNTDDATTILYSYNGDFSKWSTNLTQTVCLPMYTFNPINTEATTVTITDSQMNTSSGVPTLRRPPVINMPGFPNTNYIPVNQVFQSTTFTDDYFVVVVVSTNTNPRGGYLNYFESMTPFETGDGMVIGCQMIAESGYQPVAIIGVVPSTQGYYNFSVAEIDGIAQTGASWGVDWGVIQPI